MDTPLPAAEQAKALFKHFYPEQENIESLSEQFGAVIFPIASEEKNGEHANQVKNEKDDYEIDDVILKIRGKTMYMVNFSDDIKVRCKIVKITIKPQK